MLIIPYSWNKQGLKNTLTPIGQHWPKSVNVEKNSQHGPKLVNVDARATKNQTSTHGMMSALISLESSLKMTSSWTIRFLINLILKNFIFKLKAAKMAIIAVLVLKYYLLNFYSARNCVSHLFKHLN